MAPKAPQASAPRVWTVRAAFRWMHARFIDLGIDTPRLDAELLLAEVLATDRVGVFIRFDQPLEPAERHRLRALTRRRLAREPVAYILGRKAFADMDLTVTPAVLIPRPATEFVLDAAAELAAQDRLPPGPLADLGTGSGAIAAALTRRLQRPVTAVDNAADALAIARINIERWAVQPVELRQGTWTQPLPDATFALVASNPPYVPAGDLARLAPELAHEPTGALSPGDDGLAAIRQLAREVGRILRPGGWWLCEIGNGQAAAVERLLATLGWQPAHWWQDFHGVDRVFATQPLNVTATATSPCPGETQKPLDSKGLADLTKQITRLYINGSGWRSNAATSGFTQRRGAPAADATHHTTERRRRPEVRCRRVVMHAPGVMPWAPGPSGSCWRLQP